MTVQDGAGAEGVQPAPTGAEPTPSQETVAAGTSGADRDLSKNPDHVAIVSKLQSERDKERNRAERLERELEEIRSKAQVQGAKNKAALLREKGLSDAEIDTVLADDIERQRQDQKARDAANIRAAVAKEFSGLSVDTDALAAIPLGNDAAAYADRVRAFYERAEVQAEREKVKAERERVTATARQANAAELTDRQDRGADRLAGHEEPGTSPSLVDAYHREKNAVRGDPAATLAVMNKYWGKVPELS
jgi:hypothetical protein